MIELQKRISNTKRSMIRKIKEDLVGTKITLDFSIGIPDFPIHPVLQEQIVRQIQSGKTTYSPNRGDEELVDALAKHYQVENEQVVVTIGSAQGIFVAMFSTLVKGDKAVILCPGYPAYANMCTMLEVEAIFFYMEKQIAFDKLADACKGAKMLVVCSPNNPDGRVLTYDEVKTIAEIANKNNMIILADECYESLCYVPHTSFFPFSENCIKVTSVSKMLSATGIRVGWMLSHDKTFMREMVKVQNVNITGAPTAEQKAVAYCVKEKIIYHEMKSVFEDRIRKTSAQFTKHSIAHNVPQGAFYIFPNIKIPSYDFCIKLAKKTGILVVPGSGFELGEGHIRISLSAPIEKILPAVDIIAKEIAES